MSTEVSVIGELDGKWHYSDGSSLPVVRGGDGPEGTGDANDTGEGDQGEGDQPDYSLGGNFLKDVPEEHRGILEPYVKKWDSGVTRRFQELHSQLNPYTELGADPEDLQQALQLARLLDEDPERIYQALREQFEEQGDEDDDEDAEPFQGLPPELASQLTQQQQVLEALAEYVLNQQQTSQEAQEDRELEGYLGLLKDEFGDFDEDYVLAKMYRGMDGETAVKQWQNTIQEQLNKNGSGEQKPRLPAILSGGGVVPAEQQNVAKIPRNDLKKMVAQMMQQASEG